MSGSNGAQPSVSSKRFWFAQILAVAAILGIIVPAEYSRLANLDANSAGVFGWLIHLNVDTTPAFIFLLLLPACWFFRRPLISSTRLIALIQKLTADDDHAAGRIDWRALILAIFVGLVSLAVSFWFSTRPMGNSEELSFGSLPPAYHDEYSYLFQAETFLAGRLWLPSHETQPRLFDQMHVLNEGRFASRYYPTTGLWIAPFLKIGHPYWGHWLAGALTAMLIFGCGRELSGNAVGFLAGLFVAISPGMGIFSNLLLAHHPTLAALSGFLFFFLRLLRTHSTFDAFCAGTGLAIAMLGRPMTALGFSLPCGVWFACWLLKNKLALPNAKRMKIFIGMGLPIFLGLFLMFGYNKTLTGSGWKMPYQLYTDLYTPRHVFGFDNVVRGEQKLGPQVLENYDRWAINLTPELALQNVKNRFLASWQWTLGLVPLLVSGIVFVVLGPGTEKRWWLIPAGIVSLHVAHIPYWYDGIMHWHYVFETGPLWVLLFASATVSLVRGWEIQERPWMKYWWSGLVLLTVATSYISLEPFWSTSRADLAVNNVGFSRLKYERVRRLVHQSTGGRRALILVKPDPADRHIDYVVNDPALSGQILFGRYREEPVHLQEILSAFPDRDIYLFDVQSGRLLSLK